MKMYGVAAKPKPKLMPLVMQPQPPISANGNRAEKSRHSVRWGMILLWFMRLLAAMWMLRGILLWLGILHVSGVQAIELARLPLSEAALTVFFAVFDLVAAVGLWLAAPWGGVLWLVAVLAQVAHLALVPERFWSGLALNSLNVALIALYFGLSYAAARERDFASQ